MIKFIITSIAVFVVVIICILIFMTIMNAKKIEDFYVDELVQYPPEKPINVSGILTSPPSSVFSGKYYQTFTSKNDPYRIDYGTTWNGWYLPSLFFDYDTNVDKAGAHFQTGGYNTSDGSHYAGVTCPLINNIKGDWISINLPKPTAIKKYGFIARRGLVGRSPGAWKLYGYNKGSNNPTEIDSNDTRLKNDAYDPNKSYTYLKNILSNEKEFDSYLFVFTKAAQSPSGENIGNNYMINFTQILLFGNK